MKQKRQTIAGSALPVLLLTLLLCVAQTASRPSTENDDEGDIAVLPPDADNIEFHHVKVVNGVMQEDHPVVMYKEDFVSEDYDPSKNETKVNHQKLFRRQQRIRHHHLKSKTNQPLKVEEPQEKIVFDVLPEIPLVMNVDDSIVNNFEVAQLVKPLKEEAPLQKYSKKYHSRQRRQAQNPYARHHSFKSDYYADQQHAIHRVATSPYYLPVQPPTHYQRYPVAGKKPKYRGKLPIWQTEKQPPSPDSVDDRNSFGNENENSLFHNSNPDDADFSVFDQPRPDRNNGGAAAASSGGAGGAGGFSGGGASWQSPPVQDTERPPVWGASNSRPSWTTRRPVAPWSTARTTRRPVTRPPQVTSSPARPAAKRVSSCVWAIVNCCSQGTNQIRYDCFEEFGCYGAFWGLNPCADNIRDNAIASLTR